MNGTPVSDRGAAVDRSTVVRVRLLAVVLGALAAAAVVNVPLQAIATMILVRARGSVWATVGAP
jgi:hypothetical protein